MYRNRPSSLRAALLLLILIVGPLKAQIVFACSMMDGAVHGECCCVKQEFDDDCADASCNDVLHSTGNTCCERAVEIGLDAEAWQHAPTVKPTEVRSDVDPPTVIVASIDVFVSSQTPIRMWAPAPVTNVGYSASKTYLNTRRLRI